MSSAVRYITDKRRCRGCGVVFSASKKSPCLCMSESDPYVETLDTLAYVRAMAAQSAALSRLSSTLPAYTPPPTLSESDVRRIAVAVADEMEGRAAGEALMDRGALRARLGDAHERVRLLDAALETWRPVREMHPDGALLGDDGGEAVAEWVAGLRARLDEAERALLAERGEGEPRPGWAWIVGRWQRSVGGGAGQIEVRRVGTGDRRWLVEAFMWDLHRLGPPPDDIYRATALAAIDAADKAMGGDNG